MSFEQPINQKWSIVAIMDNHREFTFFMASGIREKRTGRQTYNYTTDRSKAAKFSKLGAEDLVSTLRNRFGRIARVEQE